MLKNIDHFVFFINEVNLPKIANSDSSSISFIDTNRLLKFAFFKVFMGFKLFLERVRKSRKTEVKTILIF